MNPGPMTLKLVSKGGSHEIRTRGKLKRVNRGTWIACDAGKRVGDERRTKCMNNKLNHVSLTHGQSVG